jgi:hypothetical protein
LARVKESAVRHPGAVERPRRQIEHHGEDREHAQTCRDGGVPAAGPDARDDAHHLASRRREPVPGLDALKLPRTGVARRDEDTSGGLWRMGSRVTKAT